MKDRSLYLVITEEYGNGRSALEIAKHAIKGGVDIIQMREKTKPTKELIALGIAITRECDGCVLAHVRGAKRAGATRQEIAETCGVAILMNGGPGTVWGPRALALYDELATSDSPSA